MAISRISRKKADEPDNLDTGLIDPPLLQKMQDYFCNASDVYLVCLGREEGVITKAYGTKEQLSFIHEIIDKTLFMTLIKRMHQDDIEELIEERVPEEYIKVCGVSTRIEGKTQVIWVAIGIIGDKVPEDVALPEGIKTTTEERYYRSIELLEVLSRQMFHVKLNELIAHEAMQKSLEAEELVTEQLHRSEAMTEIVRMLESDNGFSKIVDDALKETCECLGIAGGCLLKENPDGTSVDMIAEYVSEELDGRIASTQNVPKESFPFFTGKQYWISADSMKPESFEVFFKEYQVSAAIFQPIEVKEKVLMYLCFYDVNEERIWDVEDIKFVNDVKRIIQSILSKRIAKNSLASSYASLEAILENVGCGIYVADVNRQAILYTNQRFLELFAKTIEEGSLEEFIFSSKEFGNNYVYEEIYSVKEERWFDIHKTQITWVDGRKVSLCTIYDITEKKKYQKKIEKQANNDFLTGLFNRMRCEQDLDRYIKRAEVASAEGALIYIDLDDFKHLNDGLGHQYGDVLLKAVSHSLKRIEGISNTCYRMGGDEFIAIVPDSEYKRLDDILKDIQDIFTKPWFLKGEDYYCTSSMGVVTFPTDASTVEDVIRKADVALFSAKRRGKNCVEHYNDNDEASAHRRLDMEKNMRNAALNSQDEFEIYYQPIMDASKEGMPCCGAEALVRWNSSTLGFLQPNDFIPLAEYLGLINPIGDHVLMHAAKRCKYWNDMGHPTYKVNVNLSVVQLLQNDIVKKVKNVLEESRINPKNLTLEVTESLAINDMDRMKRILGEIKALGVNIALDDFGTGYSSLNHIREMPIDVIKIDRCFVEHVGEDDFSDAFVRMVAELASSIGVTVCVEGVENKSQLEMIREMKIRLLQGYLFGRPMKIEDFEKKYL